MVAALNAVERFPLQGWRRHLTTVTAAVAVSITINGPHYFLGWPWEAGGLSYGIASSPLALLFYTVWLDIAVAFIARAWLIKSREEIHASDLLTRIRSDEMSVRRRLVEGRLKAIQARVDPVFFFDMLEAVQNTYRDDAGRAEQLLDELTTFLRAALPRLRTASSTVDQEIDLARSFARLHVLAKIGNTELEVDVAPAVGSATFPPGVIVALIEAALAASESHAVRVSFFKELAKPALVMQLSARADPSAAAVARTRATLHDLFGARADVSVTVESGSRTIVRVPYEHATA